MKQSNRASSIALILGGSILVTQCHAGWSYTVVHPSGATTSAASSIRSGRAVGNVDGQTATWIVNVPGWTTMGPGDLYKTDGVQQVGVSAGNGGFWTGTPGAFYNLLPTQIPSCYFASVRGVFAGEQAGGALVTVPFLSSIAGIWQDSPGSFTSLAPAGTITSIAEDIYAGQQTGAVILNGGTNHRAVVWYGTPASVVDLHPPLAVESYAYGCYAGKQAGYYISTGQTTRRAALWSGTSGSMVDLHPPTAPDSIALATYINRQAGYTTSGGLRRAAVWNSTAQSYVDLHQLLANNYEASEARGIWTDNAGVYTYVSGVARLIGSSNTHAIIWKLTPDQNITLTVNLLDTVAIFAGPRIINYEVVKAGNTIASGSSQVFQSGFSLTVPVPINQLGAATITLDGSSFLRRKVAFTLTGANQGLGTILVKNGDADLSGEVDAADIDLVVAEFGSQAIGNTDVDVSGEVDAADIDIVIANFGEIDNP